MGPEARIQTEILLAFGNLPWLRIARFNSGSANIRGRWVKFGIDGMPDIAGVMLPHGRAVGIEVKSPTGQQRDTQRRFEAVFTKFGGLYILARSVADCRAAFIAAGVPASALPAASALPVAPPPTP